MQAYYSVHTATSRDFSDLLRTYRFILDALVEQDGLPPGQSPLRASDSLAPFDPAETVD